MKPTFLPGDLALLVPEHWQQFNPVMVVSVTQSNNVPDAKERGLNDLQSWSYWVLRHNGSGLKLMGPLNGRELASA